MSWRRVCRGHGATLWLSIAIAACDEPIASPQPTLVFAAASLTAPFAALGAAFERERPGSKIDLHFAGTPQLVMQLREGAAADVFAAADETNMQRVVAGGTTVGAPQAFARNRLAIAVKRGNPRRIAGLADLARPGLKVALAGPEVPVGRYARQTLTKAGVTVISVSDEPNSKALVSKVHLGEIDAAIVYGTDVRGSGVAEVPIPEAHNVVARYPIVVLGAGKARSSGSAFVEFVLSASGQRLLTEHGFLSP